MARRNCVAGDRLVACPSVKQPLATTIVGGLREYMDGLVEDLRRTVPLALGEWDKDAVHDVRVATRRLKAALDLLEGVISPARRKRFARLGRTLRRRLGPLRDLDVMLGHLADVPGGTHGASVARAVEWASGLLTEQSHRAQRKSSRVAVPEVLADLGRWWGIREEVGAAPADVVATTLRESLRQQLREFDDTAQRLAAAAAILGGKAPSDDDSLPRVDPHALRITGKRLRYTLELAGAGGCRLPKQVFSTFKRLQGDLGLWHDHVVLHQTVLQLALEHDLACHDRVLYAEVLDLARLTWQKAQSDLQQFIKRWKRAGTGVVERITRDLVDGTEGSGASASSETRTVATDGDLAGSEPPEAAEEAAAESKINPVLTKPSTDD